MKDPNRKNERNALRKLVNEGGLSALYKKVRASYLRRNKEQTTRLLDDIYDTFEYWVYEEACEFAGLCG